MTPLEALGYCFDWVGVAGMIPFVGPYAKKRKGIGALMPKRRTKEFRSIKNNPQLREANLTILDTNLR